MNAATLYWSGNGSTLGGSGTWNTSNAHFGSATGGPFATTWDNTANAADLVDFRGVAGTVTLGADITVKDLTFTLAGYTLGGAQILTNNGNYTGPATLASDLTVYFPVASHVWGGSGNNTINAKLTGPGGWTKAGGAVFKLTNPANDYAGTTTIQGNLGGVIFAANALSTNNVILNSGAQTLSWDAGNTQDISARLRINNSFNPTLDVGNNNVTFANAFGTTSSGTVSSGGFNKTGTGSLTLQGVSTFTGATVVKSGTLIAGTNSPSGSAGAFGAGSSAVLLGDATGSLSATLLTGGAVTIGRAVTVQSGNTGFFTLGGNTDNTSTFSGAISLNKDLTVTQVATTGTNALQLTGGVSAGSVGNRKIAFDNAGSVIASTTAIADGSGTIALTKTGAGTLTFSGTNTYTGPTVVNGGTLQIGNGGTAGALATSVLTNNATLVYNRSDDMTVGYAIGGGGQLIKQGAGNLNLTVPSTYAGDTAIAAGTFTLNHPNPGNDASTVTIAASGATLNLNFSGTDVIQGFFVGGTQMSNGVYKASGNPAPGVALDQITGPGTLTVSGDVTPPTVESFAHDASDQIQLANTLITYTVTFNEDMDATTVSAADFANAGTAPVTIGTVTETAPGVFTVPVTPTDSGSLQLQVPAGATLSDVASNALVTTSAMVDSTILGIYVADLAMPVLRGTSPVANSSGSTLSIALPTGVKSGDLLIANVGQYGGGSGSPTASGWTLLGSKKLGNNNSSYGAILYKFAGPGETGPCGFTLQGSAVGAGVILAFAGVSTGSAPTASAFDSGTSASATVGPAGSVSTAASNSVVVLLGMAVATDSVTWSGWSNTSPGSLDEVYDLRGSGTGNNAVSLGAAYKTKPATGSTGTGTAQLSASARNGSMQLALKPAYNTRLMNALLALKSHITGEAPLSSTQIAGYKTDIDAEKSRFGDSASIILATKDLVETYDTVLGPLWVARTLPDRASVTSDLHWTLFNVMQNVMDYTFTSAGMAKYGYLLDGFKFGSSANFPGDCPPPADPNQTHTAVIDGNFPNTWGRPVFGESDGLPARKPTGTYLAPGSIATVTVPAALVGKGYQIRVGCHSWDLTVKGNLKRLDRVSLVYSINSTNTQVANPLGGGIYIEVPQYVTNVGIVSVQIKNAVRSPYFSAKSFHQTTLAEWRDTERQHPAPWADFQSEKFMMQVPTSWIYALEDPVTLMADWNRAADICNDLMGFPLDRGWETFYDQVDLVIRDVAYAPGYPAVNDIYTPGANYGGYANNYLVRGPQLAPYVHFHEHGHGYLFQRFSDEMESNVNLLHVAVWHQGSGYSLDEAFRESVPATTAYATMDTTAIAWMMCDNFLNGIAMQQAEKNYQLKGHAKFVDVARIFGWEKLHNYYYSCNAYYEQNGVTPPTDVDSLLLRLSVNAGVDVRPLFHFWGRPPANSTSLGNSIKAANLPASAGIYDTLVRYKSLIPANNTAFRDFATNWWGRVPTTAGNEEEDEHTQRWNPYDEAFAASTASRVQQIINLYFPTGRPSDYLEWVGQWPGTNLTNSNADLDGDGMSNDHERIWGLNPADASSSNPLTSGTDLKSGAFSYTRRTRALTGLSYTAWTSTNLVDWTQDTSAVQTPGIAVNQVETVSVTLSPGLLSQPKLFVRMRAE